MTKKFTNANFIQELAELCAASLSEAFPCHCYERLQYTYVQLVLFTRSKFYEYEENESFQVL